MVLSCGFNSTNAKNCCGIDPNFGHNIRPLGLMHSHKVASADLHDEPADSMQNFLLSDGADQVTEIRALSFFLGPSLAITDWLPENLQAWKDREPEVRQYRILDPLFSPGTTGLPVRWWNYAGSKSKVPGLSIPRWRWWITEPPLPEVNQVREDVGDQMRKLLGTEIGPFSTCAMERRPDPQYDFNNPLLEDLLQQWMETGVEEVVLSQFSASRKTRRAWGRPRPDLPAFY